MWRHAESVDTSALSKMGGGSTYATAPEHSFESGLKVILDGLDELAARRRPAGPT